MGERAKNLLNQAKQGAATALLQQFLSVRVKRRPGFVSHRLDVQIVRVASNRPCRLGRRVVATLRQRGYAGGWVEVVLV